MPRRLIDANELWVQIYKLSHEHPWKNRVNLAFKKCLGVIQFFPTVDAVEVVRCKDCKDYRRWIDTDLEFCARTECETTANNFCSWGKRWEEKC